MTSRFMVCALIAVIMLAAGGVRAQSGEPGKCPSDSKLLNGGPTLVQGDGPGTWWGLVIDGLNEAGFATDEQKVLAAWLWRIKGELINWGRVFTSRAEALEAAGLDS